MCTKFELANEDAYRLLSTHLYDKNVHYLQDLKKYFDSCGGQISMKTVQVCTPSYTKPVQSYMLSDIFCSVLLLSAVERTWTLSQLEHFSQRSQTPEHTHYKSEC